MIYFEWCVTENLAIVMAAYFIHTLFCFLFLRLTCRNVSKMACSSPATSSTKQTTNYARLCRLLVDVGTQALRDTFNAIHAPPTLQTVLAGNKGMVLCLAVIITNHFKRKNVKN